MKKQILLMLVLLPAFVFSQSKCLNEAYNGHDRSFAKTSVAKSHATETFSTIPALFRTLPVDVSMTSHDPAISKDPGSERVDEENRNVTVTNAYLFAIYRESDNDFHVIIGSKPDYTKAILMNIEISGLPPASSVDYATLKAVREKVKAHFGNICGKQIILKTKPVQVSVTGSLFFDVSHKAGVVGPAGLKPKTAWEMHPVTDITFK
jgi:hypothetical protein